MASSLARINGCIDHDAPETQRAPAVGQPQGARPLVGTEEGQALLRRALRILEGAERLLAALAPSEIQTATARVYLGRASDDTRTHWRVYAARHRALAGLYESQRNAFATAVRAHLAPRSAPSRCPAKGV